MIHRLDITYIFNLSIFKTVVDTYLQVYNDVGTLQLLALRLSLLSLLTLLLWRALTLLIVAITNGDRYKQMCVYSWVKSTDSLGLGFHHNIWETTCPRRAAKIPPHLEADENWTFAL